MPRGQAIARMSRCAWIVSSGLVLLTACAGLDDFEEVIIDEATIPGMSPIQSPFDAQYGSAFNALTLSKSRTFQNNGVTPDDVDAIFVRSVVLEMDTGSATLNKLDDYFASVSFHVSAPGVEQKTFASISEFPASPTVNLTIDSDLNLKPYAVAPSMSVGAEITLKQQPFVNIKLKTTLTLLIDINLL